MQICLPVSCLFWTKIHRTVDTGLRFDYTASVLPKVNPTSVFERQRYFLVCLVSRQDPLRVPLSRVYKLSSGVVKPWVLSVDTCVPLNAVFTIFSSVGKIHIQLSFL